MSRHPVTVAGVVASLVICLPSLARAHPGGEAERVIVERLSPPARGVTVRAIEGEAGKVALRTRGTTTAVVLGADGRPILRVGPAGVEANRASPAWYESNSLLGNATVPPAARRGARPRWVRVSSRRAWEWFDHRFHPADRRAVDRWTIPIVVDGEPVRVHGRVRPLSGAFKVRLDAAGLGRGVRLGPIDVPSPALRLRNAGRRTLTVLGPEREVFARIGPRGVEVNLRSPVWAATAQYRGHDLLGSVVDPRRPPEYLLVSRTPELIWPDPRLMPAASRSTTGGPAPAPGRPIEVRRWSVPIRVDGARGGTRAVTGRTILEATSPKPGHHGPKAVLTGAARGDGPSDDGGPPALPLLALATVLAGGLLVAVRARAGN